MPTVLRHLSSVIPPYQALLLDLWGCVHDGTALYPGALECLERLKAHGKRVLFLSNAPRRASKAQAVLDMLGIGRDLYEAVVTSGEVGFASLKRMTKENASSSVLRHPSSYFYIGPPKDADVLHGLPYSPTPRIEDAGFLLNVGFGSEAQSAEDYAAVLRAALARNLPMLCLNPDMEVVKITGERMECAGVIAQEYERMGGQVNYYGKPYGEVYDYALLLLGLPREAVLAVGDGLHTDILGARRAGIASVLIAGGILHHEPDLEAALAREGIHPDYVLPNLRW